jgi:hypothetical protein
VTYDIVVTRGKESAENLRGGVIDPRVQSAVEDQLHGLRGRRGVEHC